MTATVLYRGSLRHASGVTELLIGARRIVVHNINSGIAAASSIGAGPGIKRIHVFPEPVARVADPDSPARPSHLGIRSIAGVQGANVQPLNVIHPNFNLPRSRIDLRPEFDIVPTASKRKDVCRGLKSRAIAPRQNSSGR